MTRTKLKVAAAQAAPVFLNREKTVEKACELIAKAAEAGARLVVFPEAFIAGYPDWAWVVPNYNAKVLNELHTRLIDNAVTIPDESTKRLCDSARRRKIHVVMGMHERNAEASNASVYNTILFINDRGEIMGKRRKLIPTGAERMVWAQGDGCAMDAFDTPFGRISGLICWENFMPLARQTVYAAGTQILATPTWDKSDNWLASLQHIAREGGVFVVNCCMAIRMDDIPDSFEFKTFYPSEREWISVGNSCVINPKGEMIAGPLEAKEDLVIAEVDLDEIIAAKRMFDAAGHYARPDIFSFSVRRPSEPTDAPD
jgi:nitrilase